MKIRVKETVTTVLILCAVNFTQSMAQQGIEPVSSQEIAKYFDEFFKVDPRLVNGDFYQTGKISNFAPMLIRHNWSIEEAEDQDLDFNAHHGFLR